MPIWHLFVWYDVYGASRPVLHSKIIDTWLYYEVKHFPRSKYFWEITGPQHTVSKQIFFCIINHITELCKQYMHIGYRCATVIWCKSLSSFCPANLIQSEETVHTMIINTQWKTSNWYFSVTVFLIVQRQKKIWLHIKKSQLVMFCYMCTASNTCSSLDIMYTSHTLTRAWTNSWETHLYEPIIKDADMV